MSTPTRTPIVVNSSPILGPTTKIPHLSSSPGLPSLNDVRGSQNSAMTGPSYGTAPTSITTIPALRPTTELEDSVIELPSPAAAAPLPLSTKESAVQQKRKPRAKNLEHGNPIPSKLRTKKLDENGDPIPPKPRSKKLDENGNPIPTKPRARKFDANGNPIPPKSRAKKVDENGNPILPKPQALRKPKIVTDTSVIDGDGNEASAASAKPARTAPSACKKKAPVTSVYFDASKDKEKPVKLPSLDEAPLNLEPAIPRRKYWTPPPADIVERDSSSQSHVKPLGTLLVKRRQKAKEIFKTLESNFGCQETENSKLSPPNERPVLGKRRRVSFFATKEKDKEPVVTPAVVPEAVKAPRRKVTTLTEAVLDQFDNNRVDLTYLSGYQNPDLVEKEKDHVDFGSMKVKKKKRKEKPIDPDLILLSPGTAMKQADDQEFVFGTSSQLVREESPTFLRDLQAAIEASRQMHQEEQLESWMDGEVEGEPKRSNRLWRQASRNDDGGFIDLCDDSFDMSMEDMPVKPQFPFIEEEDPLPLPAKDTETLPDANAILLKIPCKPKPSVATQTPSKLNQGPIPHFSLPSSPPRLSIRSSPIRKTVEVQTTPLPVPESAIPDPDFDMPDFDPSPKETLITLKSPAKTPVKLPIVFSPPNPFLDMSPKLSLMSTTQLASRISSFGFKAMSSRSEMIKLLQTCYTSRSTTAPAASFAAPRVFKSPFSTTSSSPASASRNDDSVSSIPAKRSRSRRSSTTSQTGESVDESSTSPSNNPPSPKRERGRPRKNPVAEIVVVTTTTRQSPKKSTSFRKSPVRKSPMRKYSTKRTQSGNPPSSSHLITIEIPDSDDDTLELPKSPVRPKSPVWRKYKSPVREPSPVLDPDSSFSDNGYLEAAHNGNETHIGDVSLAVDPTAEKRIMFNSISEAVQTAPRTRDPANPSWFDRILLYDPITFEDLTEWLNGGQLERVGYDFEVVPGDVKAWCEAKSICCVKRETRKGKERKRL